MTKSVDEGRRSWLLNTVLGAGALGLRALASGIPVALLANPKRALADPSTWPRGDAQFLIMSTSQSGDPLNANVPGMYDDPHILHPSQPSMAPQRLVLAGKPYTAAAAWGQLPQHVLDRTCFFHHGTYTVVHPDQGRVMALMGAVSQREMLVSWLARNLGPQLGTLQPQPVALGAATSGEALAYEGHMQPLIKPLSLKATLTAPGGPLGALLAQRDKDVDAMNAWFRQQGAPASHNFIDRYALSQRQVRALSQDLLASLEAISDNGPAGQRIAALALIRMKLAPVMTMHIPFGGDNHLDFELGQEAAETVEGVATIAALMQQLHQAGLQDSVTFALLNVFGRTLGIGPRGPHGRDHLSSHHCALLIGAKVRGGVVGGVERNGDTYTACSIDAATGAASSQGTIDYEDTLAAFGKTCAAAVGVPRPIIDAALDSGRIVEAALR